jgi:hypothetical protein
LDYVKLTDK